MALRGNILTVFHQPVAELACVGEIGECSQIITVQAAESFCTRKYEAEHYSAKLQLPMLCIPTTIAREARTASAATPSNVLPRFKLLCVRTFVPRTGGSELYLLRTVLKTRRLRRVVT